jgi:hypothetical protein
MMPALLDMLARIDRTVKSSPYLEAQLADRQ